MNMNLGLIEYIFQQYKVCDLMCFEVENWKCAILVSFAAVHPHEKTTQRSAIPILRIMPYIPVTRQFRTVHSLSLNYKRLILIQEACALLYESAG